MEENDPACSLAAAYIFKLGDKYDAVPPVSFHITAQLIKLVCLSAFSLCVGIFSMTISLRDQMYL